MPPHYQLYLKNDRVKNVNAISLLLCMLSALFFLWQMLKPGKENLFYLVPFLLVTGLLVYKKFSFRKDQLTSYRLILVVAAIGWFTMPVMPWIGIAVLLLGLLEKQARLPVRVIFTNEEVLLSTLFKKVLQWTDFNNIILKDGLLTLDLKNNKLIQKNILDEEQPDENEFNAYCRNRLALAGASFTSA
jgi:hypothetical protein